MRDLRGEKPNTRCPSPPHTDRGTDSGTDRGTEGETGAEGGTEAEAEADIDRSAPCGTAEATPQDDSGAVPDVDVDDDRVWQSSRDAGTPTAPPPVSGKDNVSEKEGDTVKEKESEGEQQKKEKDKEGATSSAPHGDESAFHDNSKEESKEGREEGSVSSGVRLALLPDFRSKILWLAALVDVEGVVVIVKEELHGRLKEIVEAAYVQCDAISGPSITSPSLSSFPLPPPPSSPSSSDGSCDSFCSLVIRGIKSAAAPLSEVK